MTARRSPCRAARRAACRSSQTALPALITMLEGSNEVRRGSIGDVLRGARAELVTWNAQAAGITDMANCGLRGSPTVVKRVFAPKARADQGGADRDAGTRLRNDRGRRDRPALCRRSRLWKTTCCAWRPVTERERTMSTAPTPAAPSRAGMKKELPERFKCYKHVWVFIEYEHGQIHPVSLELLGEGRKLADKLNVRTGWRSAGRRPGGAAGSGGPGVGAWRGSGLYLRRSDSGTLPERALHQGDDRSGQHLSAGDLPAGCHGSRARPGRRGGDDVADGPDRRLHGTGDR